MVIPPFSSYHQIKSFQEYKNRSGGEFSDDDHVHDDEGIIADINDDIKRNEMNGYRGAKLKWHEITTFSAKLLIEIEFTMKII